MVITLAEEGDFILIVGGGKAGHRALNYGMKMKHKSIVIDADPNCTLRHFVEYYLEELTELKELRELNDIISPSEAILIKGGIETAFLLIEEFKFKYIFPTVPQHLAAKLGIQYLTKIGRKEKPHGELLNKILENIPSELILAKDEKDAIALVSYMPEGMYCADNCTSPDICPITRTKRDPPLYRLIRSAMPKKRGMVIKSIQIEPGLGGFKGKAIIELFKFIKRKKTFVIATSSRCHGLINALKVV